jgi:hypothetical protein
MRMSDNFDDEAALALSRVDGTPREGDEITSRRGMFFGAVASILSKVVEGVGLGEEYVRAKVAQESNAAAKTAAEAAELASKRELNEAHADIARQDALKGFIENLQMMKGLNPPQQVMALAKMMQQEPGLFEQIDKIDDLINMLHVKHGTRIEFLMGGVEA